jgi:hypothetical protein
MSVNHSVGNSARVAGRLHFFSPPTHAARGSQCPSDVFQCSLSRFRSPLLAAPTRLRPQPSPRLLTDKPVVPQPKAQYPNAARDLILKLGSEASLKQASGKTAKK